jgi:hypothetical protein
MGCEIHLFIEHKKKNQKNWWCFGGMINPGRDYEIFDNLCGVRGNGEIEPITELRGIPSEVSHNVVENYTLFIEDEDNNCSCGFYCSKKVLRNGLILDVQKNMENIK